MAEVLDAAREAYRRHAWIEAYDGYERAGATAPLGAEDVTAFADAAWWLGRSDQALSGFETAYHAYLADGDPATGARLALEIAGLWFLRGEASIGSGWVARAHRLLPDLPECAAHGFARCIDADQALDAGDYEGAVACARQVQAIAERLGDRNLLALGLSAEGAARVKQGHVAEGLAVLDEAMLPVVAGEVGPELAGNIYCQVTTICHQIDDVQRAAQWTDATQRWCDQFSSAVMFAGVCRADRVRLLLVRGEWAAAWQEAVRACIELADMNQGVVAECHYHLGEIHRLSGAPAAAELEYEQAHRLGRDPQPGLSLLRLAQGRVESARAAIAAGLRATAHDRLARQRLLVAQVEIALAAGDLDTAVDAVTELEAIADAFATSGFVAAAVHARGSVLHSQQRYDEALGVLKEASRRWRDLGAPYNLARVRVRLAHVYRALGDEDSTRLELNAATESFRSLGAAEGMREVARLRARSARPAGLSDRELDVLACIAAGQTNREIAEALFISQKTVARHVSNILTKLGLRTRTAAAVFASEHGLIAPGHG